MDMSDDGTDRQHLLATYLNDHLMGASAGVDLFNRVAGSYSDPGARAELTALADEVAEDRDSLLVVMGDLGIRPRIHRMLAGGLAEKVGRLKPNGTLWHRSRLTDLSSSKPSASRWRASSPCGKRSKKVSRAAASITPSSRA